MLILQALFADIRYALRQFRLSPVFAATAIVTLALGIGATTAIFSLVHAILLRSLPVADPASLYRIGAGQDCCVEGGLQDNWSLFSYALYQNFKAAAPEFDQLAAFEASAPHFSVRRGTTDLVAKPLRGEFVTGNYFSMFGIGSFAGRVFTSADDRASATPVAVLSYRAWQQNYGSDPSVIGSVFIVEGHPFTVIGIAPPGFFGDTLRSDPPELWVPLQQEPMVNAANSLLRTPTTNWLRIIGRLKPGTSVSGMSTRFTALLRRWLTTESGFPAQFMPQIQHDLPKQNIKVVPAGAGVGTMQANYHASLNILLTVCGLVLLIACANIANLLLARGMARRGNASLRLALGASRSQLIRQSLTESILLGLLGGAAGVALAYLGARAILVMAFGSAHFVPIDVSPSLPILAFATGLSVLTGILFGTAPAWFTSNSDPVEALRGLNRSTGAAASLPQRALLIAQAALSVVLLAGAALLTHSLNNLEHQDFGYPTDGRLSILIEKPLASYSPEKLDALYRRLEDRLSRLPDVERASLALYTPFTDNRSDGIVVEGRPQPALNESTSASYDLVTPNYFATLGQSLLRGRLLSPRDTSNTRPVAVVNQAFVRRFFPKHDPIGQHFGFDLIEYAGTFEIVGVVRDAKYQDPEKPANAMFFLPLLQHIHYKNDLLQQGETSSHFIESALLLVHGDTGKLEPQIRKTFSDIDPDLAVLKIQTLQQQVDLNFDQQRAVAQLTGLFGIVALLLAAVGLYGVTAYTVARRTSEIGVRMALGADRLSVTRLVLRGAFLQVAIGLLIGIPIAIGAGRLLSAQLYQVQIWDPLALSVATLSLGICALFATVIPARRAASIDPMKALRTE